MRAIWWGALVLCVAASARADIIYLSEKGTAKAALIEAQIRPSTIQRAGGQAFVRGRILHSHPVPRMGYVLTLQPSRIVAGKQVWATTHVQLEKPLIARIDHEMDSHLDLQVLVSSRDAINPVATGAARLVAPIGSQTWRARLDAILNPNGPTEPPGETAALTHRGSIMFALIEEPTAFYPKDPAGQAAYRRYTDEARQRQMERIRTGGVDLFHPWLHRASADQVINYLVDGAAVAERYGHADRDDPTFEKALLDRSPGPGEGKNLVERAIIVGAYVCQLRATPRAGRRQRCPVGKPCVNEPVLDPTGARIADHGILVTPTLLSLMQHADDEPTPNSSADRAALAIEPAARASIALRMYQACRPRLERETMPFVKMFTAASRDLPAATTTARQAFRGEARKGLLAMLRPDLSGLAEPELSTRRAAAQDARRWFAEMFFDPDPAHRAAALSIVIDGERVNDVVDRDGVDMLFAAATRSDGVLDHPDGAEVRAITRRYATTLLMVLGTLDDPRQARAPSHPVAEHVRARVREARKRRASGHASSGDVKFLDLLEQRPRELTGPLARRASRFLQLL